jgi:hypothetical protein
MTRAYAPRDRGAGPRGADSRVVGTGLDSGRMTTMQKQKIAVLGGGVAALSTVYSLTSEPG